MRHNFLMLTVLWYSSFFSTCVCLKCDPVVLLSNAMFVVSSAGMPPSAICQLDFSLSFSVLCISGRLNSPFLSKQSCDPEPLRSPVRQASPLRARGTHAHLIISSLSHFQNASPYFIFCSSSLCVAFCLFRLTTNQVTHKFFVLA